MAEEEFQQEKTLEPTERRLQKAREEGQFPQSRDLTTLVILSIFFLLLFMSGPALVASMVSTVREGLTFSTPDRWVDDVNQWISGALLDLLGLLALILIPVVLAAIFAPLSLSGLKPVFVLKFNSSRLNPIKGLANMLSLATFVELIKTILKAFLVIGIGGLYLYVLLGNLTSLIREDFEIAVLHSTELIFNGTLLMLVPLVLIAVGDAVFQRFNFTRKMRMSREEVKQEMKETEGSPELRARLRQRQRQIAMSRMMSAVERADVVVTNPDHFSVALRYDDASMAAPVVVAKGTDDLALRIQEIAREHQVPIARIPPLARLMYARLEIGQPIPEKLFEAVAKVMAWAYELRKGTKQAWDLPEIDELPVLDEPEK